jgi:hypothetical protein
VPIAKYLASSHFFSGVGSPSQLLFLRIHSGYVGDKAFPKNITEFEIRGFFTLSATRAIRVDSNKRSRLALAPQCNGEPLDDSQCHSRERMPLLRRARDPLPPAHLLRSGDGEQVNHQECARRAGAAIGTIHDDLGYEASYTLCALAYRRSSNHDALTQVRSSQSGVILGEMV